MNAKKVLVVDDDMDFLRGLVIRLKTSGYEVLCARDGMQAIGVARRERPDLLLLDIGLPAGDGYVVMDRLKMLTGGTTPIIVLSAKDPATHREKALAAGASVFLHKPVENHVLLSMMRQLLGEPTQPVHTSAEVT
jgi:DNA-binding response OmpR family regulator